MGHRTALLQLDDRKRKSQRAESAAAPIVKVNSGTATATGKPETPPSSLAAAPTTSAAPSRRKRKRRERTQQRHQSLRQTAAQRRPLTWKIRLQGLPLPRHQRLRPRAGGLGAAG
ncbi:unnamed protein product [Pylaiella littoralis]